MRKVEVKIAVKAEPVEVIDAFMDLEKLKEWWGVERALIKTHVGHPYVLTWLIGQEGFGYVTSGIVELYDRNAEIKIRDMVYLNPQRSILGPMSLTVRAEKNYSATQVYLCQDGYQSGEDWNWYYAAVKEAWPETMQKLKNYLEGN